MGRYICWFAELGEIGEGEEQRLVDLAGGKGANLARLWKMRLPVPPGFVITTEAYRAFLAANSLLDCPPDKMGECILAGNIPSEVSKPVLEAYRRLASPADHKVAVRSSGTAEDLAAASFAGQHDTFLNVSGENALLDAVRACWASLWSPRAVGYRAHEGWDAGREPQLALAVVVQVMVPAEWAGVIFTADPVSGRRDRIVLEAVRGLGEALISGQATGLQYILDKSTLRLLNPAGAPPAAQDRPDMPRAIIEELAPLAVQVEGGFGSPQDIEWACADGRCYLLQARPLTALPLADGSSDTGGGPRPDASPAPHGKSRYSRVQRAFAPNAIDHVPVAFYPFDYSLFFRPLPIRAFAALRSLGLSVPPSSEVFVEVGDGVVQLALPTIRPTPKALLLPFRLLSVLGADWNEWLNECRATLVAQAMKIDGEDLRVLSEEELWERIERLQKLLLDLTVRRFIYFPHGLYITQVFALLLRLAVGRRAATLEQDLLSDIPCATTEANRELAGLAQKARSSEKLRRLFSEGSPEQLPTRLADSEEGRALTAQVDAYLQRYGLRETAMPSAALPALRDDPDVVYGLLKGLVAGGAREHSAESPPELPGDTGTAGRAQGARRKLVAALTRGRLGVKKRLLLPRLLRSLAAARAFVAFREDSHFYMFLAFPVIRRVALEIGRRLVERGVLEQAEDIFYLRMEEIRTPESAEVTKARVNSRKQARRAVEGRYTVVPAELLEQAGSSGELRGTGVSSGQAIGQVRIVKSERDFWKLQKGEVLVAPYTNPTWTPLFAVARAVVVDAGGTASHAAIVAREYGIPGVMGVGNATAQLRDGQRVLVDGKRGRVVPIR